MSKPWAIWDGSRVRVEEFGSDHWHLFRVVVDICDEGGACVLRTVPRETWTQGPTICRGRELVGHTDRDVVDDLAGEGLLATLDGGESWMVTPEGVEMSRSLENHFLGGGNYANFDWRTRTPLPERIPSSMWRSGSDGVRYPLGTRVRYREGG